MAKVDIAAEIAAHDDVTKTIITGMLCDMAGSHVMYPFEFTETAKKVMDLLKRRGYTPQIRRAGQLKNGINC